MNRSRGTGRWSIAACVAALVLVGSLVSAGWACSGPKVIEYYQPSVAANQVEEARRDAPEVVLAVQDFSTNSAYDEKRIVYRKDAYGFNYYHYHRWAAPPGMLVSDALREIYRKSDVFKSVVGGYSPRADIVAMGRVTTIEEVDVSDEEWVGRIGIDVNLRDAETGEILWSNAYLKEKTMEEKSPSGLAAAISEALIEIGSETAPTFGKIGEQHLRDRAATEAEGEEEQEGQMEQNQSDRKMK